MAKYDHILKQTLENVYFIWGDVGTTVTDVLAEKYSLYVYDTDNGRNKHIKEKLMLGLTESHDEVSEEQTPEEQPPEEQIPEEQTPEEQTPEEPEDIRQREKEVLRDFTPMVVSELIELSRIYDKILCEGELDVDSIVPIATHIVMINGEDGGEFSDCSAEQQMLEEFGAKQIIRGEEATVEETVEEVAEYFGF